MENTAQVSRDTRIIGVHPATTLIHPAQSWGSKRFGRNPLDNLCSGAWRFAVSEGFRVKFSKTLVVIVVIAAVAVAGIFTYSMLSVPQPTCTSIWKCAAPYPVHGGGAVGVAGQSCGANSVNIYCIGGVDAGGEPRNDVYTATISASGNITEWNRSFSTYPQNVTGQACAVTSGYIYCVGGIHDISEDDLSASYYAKLLANGSLGVWESTTPYPIPIDSESCVGWSLYIYCIGGNNETGGTQSNVAPSSAVWFAPVSSSGIGEWARTTSYPSGIYFPSCYVTDGFVYCLNGSDSNGDPLGSTYFAPVTPDGVGRWALTTAYPVASVGPSCVIASGYIYCIGGETAGGQSPTFTNFVYLAQISTSGIGLWTQGTSYPRNVGTSCVTLQENIYCVGGFDESTPGLESTVNYATLSSISG